MVILGGLLASAARPAEPAAAPADAPSSEETLKNLLKAQEEGRYAEADAGARELLARVEKAEGPESAPACDVLDLLVRVLLNEGRAGAPETRQLAEREVAVARKVYGEDHPTLARGLNSLGLVLLDLSDFDGARADFDKALAIREKAQGPEDPEVAAVLNSLANLNLRTGDSAAARKLDERSLAIWEKHYGPDHPKVAYALHGLGIALRNLGDFPGAKAAWERALAIWEKNYPPTHPKLTATLSNLGNLLYEIGETTRSRELRERVLANFEKTLGPNHTLVAYALNNLGTSIVDAGDLAGARPLFERALAIHEKNFGPEHLEVAAPLMNLADVAFRLGDYEEARRLQQRILAVRQKALGPENPEVAVDMMDLATVLMNLDADPQAQDLLERALAIQEKALGPEHPDVAHTCFNLAILREDFKDYAAARQLLERALQIRRKAVGEESPPVAETLEELGRLFYRTGDNAEAHRRVEKALEIRGKNLGPDHPKVAETLNLLAILDWDAGRGGAALEQSLRAEEILRNQFQRTAPSLAEREALRFESSRVSGLSVALSVLASSGPGFQAPPGTVARVWDAVIRSRALVLDEMATRHRALTVERSPEVAELARTLVTARDRLASLLVRDPDPDDLEGYRKSVEQARLEKERTERELAGKSASFRDRLGKSAGGFAEVRSALPPGWALVAYVSYNRFSPADAQGTGSATRREPSSAYLALVLRGGEPPSVLPIGGAEQVEPLIEAWKKEMASPPGGLPMAGGRAEERYREVALRLRNVVWDPVARSLRGIRKVFVVPDGAVSTLSLATLPADREGYLVESGPLIHYLSAERDLLRSDRPKAASGGLLAVGGPDFNASPGATTGTPVAAAGSGVPSEPVYRSLRAACGDFRSLRFDPLPGATEEVREIQALWDGGAGKGKEREGGPVEMLTGAAANEAAFKRMAPGHRVLHLATHGFFIQQRCASDLADARARGREEPGSLKADLPILGDSPLLLTGLALAGANRRDEAGPRSDEEDGILTAEEIASLDLTGTEWAVLSACETGVGLVQAGEGVLGIRRAFEVAGASTLILSLWKVEDESAREWMRGLYRARLAGLGSAEAVRKASLEMVRARRAKGGSTHPFTWGAFVAAGDWK